MKKLVLICLAFLVIGCQPKLPKNFFEMERDPAVVESQSRSFEEEKEKVVRSSVSVLQDMGFNVKDSDTKAGIILAFKERETTSKLGTHAKDFAANLAIAMLTGQSGNVRTEHSITVQATLVVDKQEDKKPGLRITFYRVSKDKHGMPIAAGYVKDPELFQDFYDKLSKSIFLERYSI